MDTVLGAEVVIPINAAIEVSVIVEDVVGAVGNEQAKGDDEERNR